MPVYIYSKGKPLMLKIFGFFFGKEIDTPVRNIEKRSGEISQSSWLPYRISKNHFKKIPTCRRVTG